MKILYIALSLAFLTIQAKAEIYPSQDSNIIDGTMCGKKIGSGGNLKTADSILPGKCEGSGVAPKIIDDKNDGKKVIEFSTNNMSLGSKDRSELALTDQKSRLMFGRKYRIFFKLQIPAESSVTNEFFYLVQLWQDSNHPPIGGLRMQRGQSRKVSVMFRGEGGSSKGHTLAAFEIPADQWVSVGITFNVNPGTESCATVSIDNAPKHEWCGLVGFTPDEGAKNWYRMKFGIYKGHESGKNFISRFKEIRIDELE